MKIYSALLTLLTAIAFAPAPIVAAESARVTVEADRPGLAFPSTLHGLFFEDINYGADGGLYAELIQNRSFEHRDGLNSWRLVERDGGKGALSVESDVPLNANNWNFLRIHVSEPGTNGVGAVNSGFDGIAVRKGERYFFSLYARRRAGTEAGLRIILEDNERHTLASTEIKSVGRTWKKFEATFTSAAEAANARLLVLGTRAGAVDVDMVSLFPEKTFKNRRNGLRADLAQALADMKPGFMRFPGGCIVEGRDVANMYRWKDTIGDVADRKQNWNLWQDNGSPQYHQTYGLGFFEYFQFCEDIGAEPVPVINCGMCCQARQGPVIPLDQLTPFVQDALDLIEFANGPTSSEWGARRAALGHPKPFRLKFLAVGNEQWQQGYFDRYDVFYRALKARYPEIQLISSSGPHPDDPLWHFAWNKFRTGTPADIVDEHYYVPPRWLLERVDRYDSYDRKGPKIFVGEFAGHDRGRRNTLRSALSEAAYMTSLWRNADVVVMASYAPLLAKARHAQWRPDLIWFDNTHVALTPNYYAQAQFSQNRPNVVLPARVESAMDKPPAVEGMVGVGTWRTQAEYKDIRVVSSDGRVLFESDFSKGLEGWKLSGGDWAIVDGAMRQTSTNENIRAVIGEPSWSDYTLSLRARKLSGQEGFLVIFETPDTNAPVWWNLGGWRNTEHAIQNASIPERHVRGAIETNRWYDIRIETTQTSVKAYLDNQLVHQEDRKPVATFFATAGRDVRAKEIVLQLVNPTAAPMPVNIKLKGLQLAGTKAKVITLANPNADAENTLTNPDLVVPRTSEFNGVAADFVYPMEPNSLTTLRIPEK